MGTVSFIANLLFYCVQVCRVFIACCVLHNIAKRRNVQLPASGHDMDKKDVNTDVVAAAAPNVAAQATRQHIVATHF